MESTGNVIVIACALKAELPGILKSGRFGGWINLGADRNKLGAGSFKVIYKRGDIHDVDVALVVSGMGEERAYDAA